MTATGIKKLTVYVLPGLHLRLKVEAAKRGQSMSDLVIQAVLEKLEREEEGE